MPSEKHTVARRFGAAAAHYDQAAALQRRIGNDLLEQAAIRLKHGLHGKTVLDIGSGSGHFSRLLKQAGATVWALDIAEGMLRHSAGRHSADAYLLADAESLPLADNSVDVCFSNLAVQWCDFARSLAEMRRVCRSDGLIALSTLADGSLWQLKQAWQHVDDAPHVNRFAALPFLQQHSAVLAQPELICRDYTEYYPGLNELLRDLKNIGANHVSGRSGGLMGKQRWQQFCQAYAALCDSDGRWPLTYRAALLLASPG